MKTYGVVVAFDLEKASIEQYRAAREELEKLGFSSSIRDDQSGRRATLTNTTWFVESTWSDAVSLRDSVTKNVESAFRRRGLKGKLFVEVGTEWACSITPFDGGPAVPTPFPSLLGAFPSLPKPALYPGTIGSLLSSPSPRR